MDMKTFQQLLADNGACLPAKTVVRRWARRNPSKSAAEFFQWMKTAEASDACRCGCGCGMSLASPWLDWACNNLLDWETNDFMSFNGSHRVAHLRREERKFHSSAAGRIEVVADGLSAAFRD